MHFGFAASDVERAVLSYVGAGTLANRALLEFLPAAATETRKLATLNLVFNIRLLGVCDFAVWFKPALAGRNALSTTRDFAPTCVS